MKILSWNVNGLRAVERKGALQDILERRAPDILLLQEIKGRAEQFSTFLTQHEDYVQFYHSAEKPGYAGTGIWIARTLVNHMATCEFDTHVPRCPAGDEGRVSHARFIIHDVPYSVLSIYFPNGGKSRQAWEEKLVFYDRVLDYMNTLHEQGRRVIVGGDMNVAHREIDLARPKENDGSIGFHPDERAWMDKVLADGWVDAWREQHPTDVVYSWWNLYTRARERNVGWRIDYFFVHREQMPCVRRTWIDTEIMGSDHCPVGLEYECNQ